MLLTLSHYIEHTITTFGGFGVFISSIIEEIVVPIPSTLVQSGAGMILLGSDKLGWSGITKLIVSVSLPSALGVALGSLVIYGVIFFGGKIALKKYSRFFFADPKKIELGIQTIAHHPRIGIVVTALRFIPLFPNVVVTIACGLLRIPLKTYLVSTSIGTFIRATYLGVLGWSSAHISNQLFSTKTLFNSLGILLVVLFIVSFFGSVLFKNHIKGYLNK